MVLFSFQHTLRQTLRGDQMSDQTVSDVIPAPTIPDGPCTLIFYWYMVPTQPRERNFIATVGVRDGYYQNIIDYFRDAGGMWQKDPDGVDWFLPWPPAGIKLVPGVQD